MFFPASSSQQILVVAPHADDETLGCGGLILKLLNQGVNVHWCVVTSPKKPEYSADFVAKRAVTLEAVKNAFGFKTLQLFDFSPASLQPSDKPELIKRFADLYKKLSISTILVPHRNDAHSDHCIVFDAAIAASKWFRSRSINNILSYETLSETEFQVRPGEGYFHPNYFVNITDEFEKKCEIMSLYESELGIFPFPRSLTGIKSLSQYRGLQSGANHAESFQILKSIV